MDEHPLEATLPGKLLLLTCKLVMPMLVIALLVVTPTFIPRRLVMSSYLLDLLLRLLAAAVLCLAYWKLPELQTDPRSRRFWQQAARSTRGQVSRVYLPLAVLVTLGVTVLTGLALRAFLPAIGAAGWALAGLSGAQFAILYALQYPALKTALATPAPNGGVASYRPRGSVRGVVVPRREEKRE